MQNIHSQDLLNLGYSNGTLPTNINENDVSTAFTTWKNAFVENCSDGSIRIKFDTPTDTVSEGIGYGMLIAVYMNDQNLFDGLWKYYNNFLNANGVMNWKISGCDTVLGFNGATDAELDVAMALIIAYKRWGNNGTVHYENEAKNLITIIKDHEIEANTYVLKPGDAWGGSNVTNISYFAPAYYRAYNTLNPNAIWNNVASKSYDIIEVNQTVTSAVYNLVSDWCTADGNFASSVASWATNQGKKYGYDASRTPWRIAIDYLWYGNTDALNYSNDCIDFINAKNGLDNIYPGYNLDGTPYEQSYKDVTFTGAYAVAAMASSNQTFVNGAYSKVVEMTTNAYFGSTLRVLYLLALSGNFYSPDMFAALNTDEFLPQNDGIIIYPNPVGDLLNITFKEPNTLVEIYNSTGKKVYSELCSDTITSVKTNKFSSGIYIIEVNKKKFKIIKE